MGNRFLKENKRQLDLIIQEQNIKSKYQIFNVKVKKNKLTCRGTIKSDNGNDYEICITETLKRKPKVKIINPKIKPVPEIHMYRDGSLCLYHYLEQEYNKSLDIAEYIIPWTCEWIFFYELYKKTGIWFGKESVHYNSKKKIRPF